MPFSSSPIELGTLIAMLVGSILFSLILCWFFQRKSALHPVRNGIIFAAIPSILLFLAGPVQITPACIIGGGDGPTSVFITFPSTLLGFLFFFLVLLPACTLFCKKLAKRQPLQER